MSSPLFLASYLFGSAEPDTWRFLFVLASSKPEGGNGKTLKTYILDTKGRMHIHFTNILEAINEVELWFLVVEVFASGRIQLTR